MAPDRATGCWNGVGTGGDADAPSYFEHVGGYRTGILASDFVEFEPVTVTEGEMTDDQALEFSLLLNPGHITGKWLDVEETR